MKEKTVKLAGKDVNLCYCYATEIGYKTLSDEDANDFFTDTAAVMSETPQRMPDVRKTIQMILSAAIAWYDANHKKPPVKDEDLMYRATPVEIATALVTIVTLRNEFYRLPEPVDQPDKQEGDGKNV